MAIRGRNLGQLLGPAIENDPYAVPSERVLAPRAEQSRHQAAPLSEQDQRIREALRLLAQQGMDRPMPGHEVGREAQIASIGPVQWPSMWDYFSRPSRAVSGAVMQALTPGDGASVRAWENLKGDRLDTFDDVLDAAGVEDTPFRALTSFGLEVGTDPLNFAAMPIAVPAKIANTARKVGQVSSRVAKQPELFRYLSAPERASIETRNLPGNLRTIERIRAQMPSVDELSAAVVGGREKRGWYEKSRAALQHVFADDADLFAGVLAATSPQNSVEMNLANALRIYRNWVSAGRPQDRQKIIDIMGQSVAGTKGNDSVLEAWINNTVEVLNGGNVISGPKVDSFWTNLRARARQTPYGDVDPQDAVTLDAWMANLFGIHNEAFAGASKNLEKGNPGYSKGYLAGSSLIRETAERLGIKPAEVQETAWSFGKALYEKAEALGMSAREIVEKGLLTPDDIAGTVDFSRLLAQPEYAAHLSADHAAKLPSLLQAAVEPLAEATQAQQRWMLKAADRLDQVRARRGIDSRYRTASNQPGSVVASLPIESATPPSNRSRVAPNMFDPATTTIDQRDTRSRALLRTTEDAALRNMPTEAIFPGRTGSTRRGVGQYLDQQNIVNTVPVEVRLNRSGAIPDADLEGLRAASGINAAFLGQDQAAVTALQFSSRRPNDAVRVTTPNAIDRAGVAAIRKELPPGEWVIQHRSDSVDILRLDGTLSGDDAEAVANVVRRHVPQKKTTAKALENDRELAAVAGRNVVPPDLQLRDVPWGDDGSREVTEWLLGDVAALPQSTQRRLERSARQFAADALEKYSKQEGTRPDHLNMLRIVAESGLSGLRRALGDPTQLLPMLGALGLTPVLVEASGFPSNRQGGAQ